MDAGLESHAGPSEPGDDLLDDSVFLGVLSNAHAGRWQALVAGVPCSTFSKARWRPGGPHLSCGGGRMKCAGWLSRLQGTRWRRLGRTSWPAARVW